MNEPLHGIGLNLIAGIIFCAADTIARRLAGEVAMAQIAWTRYVIFVLMALLLTTRMGGASFFAHRPGLEMARGLCLVFSSLLFVPGIRDVGLAEAATVGLIGPFLVTFLSIPLLGESVDARRMNGRSLGGDDHCREWGLYGVTGAVAFRGGATPAPWIC